MVSSKLILVSPLQGWSAPLEEAPDEVFSGRMMGDGVAIDPTGPCLHAPCDGVLVVVATSGHAVTLRADNGAEILLHVGIDTVGLAGEGFQVHVSEGDRVTTGDRLISFDLELLARRAKSHLTPVIVTDPRGYSISRRSQDCALQVGDFLMEVLQTAAAAEVPGNTGEGPAVADSQASLKIERSVLVSLEHGIHARPAASLAAAIKHLAADAGIRFGDRKANAKSPVALMSLGVRKNDQVVIRASGPDAEVAVATLTAALTAAAPVPSVASTTPAVAPTTPAVARRDPGVPTAPGTIAPHTSIKGIVASRGLGVGTAFQFSRAEIEVAETGGSIERERAELERARDAVRLELEQSALTAKQAAKEVAEAHLGLIDDPELLSGALDLINEGKTAGFAWRSVMRNGINALRALDDPRMAERADDLFDLESRVLSVLSGNSIAGPELPPESILIAHELLPSQLVALNNANLAGICLAAGGATSHAAIIAAAMDIPTLVATGAVALRVPTGTPIVLDAEAGWMHVDPPQTQFDLARNQLAERRGRRAAEQHAAQREGRTADGTRIEIYANVGSEAEAHAAIRNGAEGSGLLRTEFLFLERTAAPAESEQRDQYQQIARALEGRPLTIRTLDIGGDKPIPYLPLPLEENPALGLRGVRTSLWRPDLLRIQLRAILGVQPASQCRILLPMITDAGEVRAVRRMLEEIQADMGRREPVAVGAMIETPASAVMADRIAREADFLSIGTNDLTQYALAMDRGHPELAARLDALHPAVLKLISQTVAAARVHGRKVAVCGGLASDPVAVPILIGLGIHELSVVPAVIPRLKALISTLNSEDCETLAVHALDAETAEEVRALTLRSVSGLDATGRARQ